MTNFREYWKQDGEKIFYDNLSIIYKLLGKQLTHHASYIPREMEIEGQYKGRKVTLTLSYFWAASFYSIAPVLYIEPKLQFRENNIYHGLFHSIEVTPRTYFTGDNKIYFSANLYFNPKVGREVRLTDMPSERLEEGDVLFVLEELTNAAKLVEENPTKYMKTNSLESVALTIVAIIFFSAIGILIWYMKNHYF